MSAVAGSIVRGVLVELRRFRWLAVLLVVYVALRIGFTRLADEHGLLTPSGSPNFGVAALGIALFVTRLAVLIALSGWFAYRAVLLVVAAIAPRARPAHHEAR